jgi:hypothetical protein
MTYRDDTETVRAENERLRARVAELTKPAPRRPSPIRRWGSVGVAMLSLASAVLLRRAGLLAEIISVGVLVGLWSLIFRRLDGRHSTD